LRALLYGSSIKSIAELRTLELRSQRSPGSLLWELSTTPNLGPNGIAEIEGYRARGDPRQAKRSGPTNVVVSLDADQLAAIETWIATQSEPLSRAEAIRRLAASGPASTVGSHCFRRTALKARQINSDDAQAAAIEMTPTGQSDAVQAFAKQRRRSDTP